MAKNKKNPFRDVAAKAASSAERVNDAAAGAKDSAKNNAQDTLGELTTRNVAHATGVVEAAATGAVAATGAAATKAAGSLGERLAKTGSSAGATTRPTLVTGTTAKAGRTGAAGRIATTTVTTTKVFEEEYWDKRRGAWWLFPAAIGAVGLLGASAAGAVLNKSAQKRLLNHTVGKLNAVGVKNVEVHANLRDITLVGSVPDEATRAKAIAAAKTNKSERKVIDRLVIAAPPKAKAKTVVPAPTTAAPTTAAPTTVAPTTAAPTTVAPTTVAPTTAAPTTPAPTAVPPTPVPAVAAAPTTVADVPTSVAGVPTTVADVPTTVAPGAAPAAPLPDAPTAQPGTAEPSFTG